MLTEIAVTLYDSVAFYKHRAEGEINSTFAYIPEDVRTDAFRRARETLWALDVAWTRKPELRHVINFLRYIGGSIHMDDEAISLRRRGFDNWEARDGRCHRPDSS
ncbi:hypothetical protein D9758_013336 [Tetrapyrgos nigripes]|uniref:Uncharacterized protein n=1 Tax=Tetrapyrgos nigripes TaxID=182062 RepID=A0A8H5CCH9_9AGAR|nr:hypothetical protein D9758_013336 [Tetrapyrgos nigripes]